MLVEGCRTPRERALTATQRGGSEQTLLVGLGFRVEDFGFWVWGVDAKSKVRGVALG